ncbi:MAG: glycosyltransferase family 4 protein [Bacteroidota bacterium]
MKRVLIITYYWPPSGGAGVQRWLKFVKYLQAFGWEPVVYTPENPEAPAIDNSLAEDIPEGVEVLKTKIWEPYRWYKKFTGQKPDEKVNAGFLSEKEKPGLAEKVSVWIRGNLFIPDARKFWIKPSVKFLKNYLKAKPVDVIVSTGPPHSMHLIALALKQKTGIRWVADFRDPWTQIDFYHQLQLSKWADRKHRRLERKVLHAADKVVTVSPTCANDLEKISNKKVAVITNGFDPDDFNHLSPAESAYFELLHIGAINKDRNAANLWKALAELCLENEDFRQKLRIKLIGKTDISARKNIKENKLEKHSQIIPYLPHKEAITHSQTASLLLLPLNNTPTVKGIVTGKLFEYFAIQKPILCIGPTDGDSAKIIKETQTGATFDFEDKEGIKNYILATFQKESSSFNPGNTAPYNRKVLTGELAAVLDRLV